MRNIKLFPFERNQYFFGKLLTVNDFETEQKYFNDKRRLINRMLFGTGVVSGLSTMRVDSNTIVVESGLAIDGTGREVIVDKAVLKKLSMIDGFSDSHDEIHPYVYLCIEYDELKAEPVHSLTDSVLKDEAYNKFRESYRFYLTTDEPKKEEYGSIAQYFKDVRVIYEGNGIRVKHICPKNVENGKEFDMFVEIEITNQSLQVKLEYELDLLWLSGEKDPVKIVFDESEEPADSRVFTKKIRLKAASAGEVAATAAVKENTMKLTLVGSLEKQLEPLGANTINIITGSVKDKFLDGFFNQSLEHMTEYRSQERLYLAKIYLVRWGDSYEVGDIIKMPFNQYVTSSEINRVLTEICFEKIGESSGYTKIPETTSATHSRRGTDGPVRSGTVSIDLGDNPREGQVFFSRDIAHGFGLGDVHIILGRSEKITQKPGYIFGDAEIFLGSREDTQVSMAACADPATGMFKIGIRLLNNTDATKLDITWLAIKDFSIVKSYSDSKNISIRPDLTYVNVRETVWLEAVVTGIEDKNVTWSVKETNGGFVDKRGLYTAPNLPGVYEVVAKSVSNPEVSGSAFVAVKKE